MHIKEIIKNKTVKKSNLKPFQDLALQIIKEIPDSYKYRSSIFKVCKQDQRTALIAFNECKELDKKYSRYFLKVFNSLIKNYEEKTIK